MMTKASRYSSQAMKAEAKWKLLDSVTFIGTALELQLPRVLLSVLRCTAQSHKKELPGPKCHSVKTETACWARQSSLLS